MTYLNEILSPPPEPRPSLYEPGERFRMSVKASESISLSDYIGEGRFKKADPEKLVRSREWALAIIRAKITVQNFKQMLYSFLVRWSSMPDLTITSYNQYSDDDRSHINILYNRLHRHKKLNVRYTTYDMQEDEDVIYLKKCPNIMVLNSEHDHPYLYARVLDLFHVDVINTRRDSIFGTDPTRVEVVRVHWYELDEEQQSCGFKSLRYPSLSLCKNVDGDAYGLIHPDEIVRRVHLIPNFKALEPGMEDHERVQVNMFVLLPPHILHCSTNRCSVAWRIVTGSCASVEVVLGMGICGQLNHGSSQQDGAHHGLY